MGTDAPDIDFSGDDGLAESRHVFLQGNRLPEAWQGRPHFVVGELGFGTGLNALALAHLWYGQKAEGRPVPQLLYQSVELHPRPAEAFCEHGRRWPELKSAADELSVCGQARWGWNSWQFGWGELRLYCGDAADLRAQQPGFEPAHAWFLDGWAPARDGALWAPELLSWVATQTLTGGTAATYTAAGSVKQALRQAGFEVRRLPGWGRKRHMVQATRIV